MANNNVQNVRFLRNGTLYTTRDEALAGLNGQTLAAEQDGSIILARYGSGNAVKTLVGVVYFNGSNNSLTIFDIDGAAADVEKLRQEINAKLGTTFISSGNTVEANLTALSGTSSDASGVTSVWGAKAYADDLISTLDYTDTAVTGSYVSAVNEADGKISVSRIALPDASTVSGESKVVIDVTQDKGAITATAANITGVKLAGYEEGTDADIAATDTLGQALGKLQAQINAMDLTVVSGDGEVITAVSEADGKVSANKTAIKDVKLTGYVKDATKTGNIAATDDIEDALSKLENKAAAITITNADGSINVTPASTGTDINVNIKTGEHVIAKDGNNGLYTNISLSSITPSSTTVKEEYQLTATDGTKLGDTIKIYKDSSIVEIYLGTSGDSVDATTGVITKRDGDKQYLNYVYFKADGTYEMTKINISVFITEQEFASGVTFDSTENKVKGVVDSTSEGFLTVGADGFKLAGVQNAIDTAVSGLDASVSAATTHVTVKVDEVDGKLTAVTLTESDIANKTDLDTLSGKTVTAVEMTGGTAAIAANSTDGTKKITINTDGSQIKMTNYTKGSDSGSVASSDSINAAISKIENRIDGKVDALDATVSSETTSKHIKVVIVQENGVLSGVTLTDSDIASDSALTAEIAARKAVDGQSGQTYAANTEKAYISGATSLNDADIKLNDALASLDADVIKSVEVNGVALTEEANAVNVQISAAKGTGAESTPITVQTNPSTGAITLKLEGLDCGTY